MNEAIEELDYYGYTIKIVCDPYPEDPRQWDHLGIIATWHRRYSLGDIQPKESGQEYIDDLENGTIILPVYMYEHSGITINTTGFSCQWDSGQLGIIYATPKSMRACFGDNIMNEPDYETRVKNQLVSEVEEYDSYLRGDVYGFQVIDSHGELLDSCYGWHGDIDGLIKDAKDVIDCLMTQKYKKAMAAQAEAVE